MAAWSRAAKSRQGSGEESQEGCQDSGLRNYINSEKYEQKVSHPKIVVDNRTSVFWQDMVEDNELRELLLKVAV